MIISTHIRKSLLLAVMFFCFSGIARSQINYYDYFTDEVLRIDYLRIGNANAEGLSIKHFYREYFWSGCRTKNIEPYDYGDYKIEVYDPDSEEMIFKFSYSSLFAEYKFTEKGQTETGIFEETVRIPFPLKTVQITFSGRDKSTNQWTETLSVLFNPEAPPDHFKDADIISEGKLSCGPGNPEKNIDIAFVAEGYNELQKEKFFDDAQRVSEYLLHCSPFDQYADRINIWAVYAASPEDGVTDPSEGIDRNTILGCNFSTFDSDRYLMTEQHFTLRNLAAVVPYDHLIILVNTKKYGGGGIFNFYATCPADEPNTNFLVVHEFGHSFTGLADEYWTSDVSVIDYYNLSIEPDEPNITTLVDFASKWQDMLADDTPVPTPPTGKYRKSVGVFEGGGYLEKGIYRPFYNCTMRSVQYDAFCPVCRRAIETTIGHFTE